MHFIGCDHFFHGRKDFIVKNFIFGKNEPDQIGTAALKRSRSCEISLAGDCMDDIFLRKQAQGFAHRDVIALEVLRKFALRGQAVPRFQLHVLHELLNRACQSDIFFRFSSVHDFLWRLKQFAEFAAYPADRIMMRRGFVLDALKARRMTQVFSDLLPVHRT